MNLFGQKKIENIQIEFEINGLNLLKYTSTLFD